MEELYEKSIRAASETEEITAAPEGVDEKEVRDKYERLTKALIEKKKTITTMESCTSGQVASLITDTEGASAILKGAYVTYSNEAKIAAGVPAMIIEKYGVYSAQTAAAMSEACRNSMKADIGVGITGSFGNADPNNADSIPGEVYFALSTAEGIKCFHCSVPSQNSRSAYKLYMANVIVSKIQ
ncbi:MAG: CinA family protein [Lachnospiraceae bacterium]|nr:CinA family protein [Lachnospiraceae bacterium]